MPTVDKKKREISLRVVYHGPGLAGKTTNLHYVFERTKPDAKTNFLSVMTSASRTLSFDFVPKSIAPIDGNTVRIELITTPGPLYRDPARRLVLAGADGVVFVADSQRERIEANEDSMEELLGHLESHGVSVGALPIAVQFNKRDLPNASPVADLAPRLNPHGWPQFEAIARTGVGVFDTLKAVAKEMLTEVKARHLGGRPYRD
ncbi:MAG TPA: GTPase domain-containing protein [Labilithrix sp.]|jgi:signal recognition particle receptor subunit beta|nr:GTPase domain-containing protein [Labilithrix sp.]